MRGRSIPVRRAAAIAGVALVIAAIGGCGGPGHPSSGTAASIAGYQATLRQGWRLQSSAHIPDGGATVSTPGYACSDWHAISVPASVLAGLVQSGVYTDQWLFMGDDLTKVPAREFAVPWWYRTEFTLPAAENGHHVWLSLEGINYRADVWLNGARIATGKTIVGPFRRFDLDVTGQVRYGAPNALAIEVARPVVVTDAMENPHFGRGDLTISYTDWNPEPPDNNMGILNDVVISTSGPVVVRHPLVVSKVDPSLDAAHLTVVADVTNASAGPVSGTVRGAIGTVSFSQDVTVQAGRTTTVTFSPGGYPQLNISHPRLWWPWNYGTPNLYTLDLSFTVDGQTSDRLSTRFGIRQVTCKLAPCSPYEASRAVDGSVETRWASRTAGTQWLRVDLGRSRVIGKVMVRWGSGYATACAVQVSDDAASWRTVCDEADGAGKAAIFTFPATRARFVRLVVTAAHSASYFLRELGVYAPDGSRDLALDRPARASSVAYPAGNTARNTAKTAVFFVNGKRFQVRGTAFAPDMLQRRDPVKQEEEISYFRDANVNTIRLEGKFEDDNFFQLADRFGIMVIAGWMCCDPWQDPGTWTAGKRAVAMGSLETKLRELRIHPSVLVWLNGSDIPPSVGAYPPFVGDPSVEREYLRIERRLQWPNPILSSASSFPSKVTGRSGVKMEGPYNWEPPIYWETDVKNGGAWNSATEIGSTSCGVPPYDSIVNFIPKDDLWPQTPVWAYHDNGYPVPMTETDRRYGRSRSLAEFATRSQMLSYEANRAMLEAYGLDRYDASGVIQWMGNASWPGFVYDALFDYYLRPSGGYYGTKLALEPLHVMYSYASRSVAVLNSTLDTYRDLAVSAQVYDLDATERYSHTARLRSVGPDSATRVFTLPPLAGLSRTHFLRLTMKGADGRVVSINTYWLSTRPETLDWKRADWWHTPQLKYADLTGVNRLPPVKLDVTESAADRGDRRVETVTVTNQSRAIAFFVRLRILKGAGGEELLPVLWQDNYLTLLPGESRQVTADYAVADLHGTTPVVAVDAWNNR
jgi:Exo-beta-D-glucosaminidase Ig-fold domain/F5/8 type C domain/Glycosyl hydrolase 2 galactose-binding domain-like/Glycosyl hydrolases family 2/Mannosidase Ig/CBM-like domain